MGGGPGAAWPKAHFTSAEKKKNKNQSWGSFPQAGAPAGAGDQ
jgi:hypothetical protein